MGSEFIVSPMKQMLSDKRLAAVLSGTVASVMVLLPFHALLTTWMGSNLGHLDAIRIWKELLLVLTLPIAAVLIWRTASLKKWLIESWIVRLFCLYLLLHLLLGWWALSHHEVNSVSLIYSYIINLRFISFFILCAVAAGTSSFLIRHWDRIVLLPAAIVLIFGLFQRFVLPYDFLRHFGYGPDTISAYQTVDAKLDYQRIQSTLRGANPLGAYLVLVITVLVASLRKNRIFVIGCLIAGFMLLFYSYSRSAWIGLGLALISLTLLEKPSLARRWLVLGAIFSLIVLSSGIYALRTNNIFQDTIFHTSETSTSTQSANEQRLRALETGARDVISELQGRGPGTAGPASFRNDSSPRIAENYFLQIGQEVGILGMGLFISIVILITIELWRRRQNQLARVLLASLVGLTFVNLVSHAWTDDTLAYLWWGLAGIACAPAILSGKLKGNGQKKK